MVEAVAEPIAPVSAWNAVTIGILIVSFAIRLHHHLSLKFLAFFDSFVWLRKVNRIAL